MAKETSSNWNDPVFVLNKIINLIIFVLIALGVLFLGLFVFGIRPYAVLSGSMEPKVGVGSLVFVNQNAKFTDVQVGDVITFKSGNMTVTHRVHEIDEAGIVTKGDANEVADGGHVTAETFVGKDIYVIPKLGFLIEFIQSVKGMIISATVFFVLAVGSILTGRDDEDEKDGKKTKKKTPAAETNTNA